jgi:hypothetical protein
MGTAVATTDCNFAASEPPYGSPCPSPPCQIIQITEDSGASDSPGEVALDAADMSMSMTTMLTDSSSAADVPSAVAAYGAAVIIDE